MYLNASDSIFFFWLRFERKQVSLHLTWFMSIKRNYSVSTNGETIELMRWLKRHEFSNDRQLQICHFPEFGCGLLSRQNIRPHCRVITIPVHLTINFTTIQNSKWIQHHFRNQQLNIDEWFVIFLIYERSQGSKSFWDPYINALPKSVLAIFNCAHYMFSKKRTEVQLKFEKILSAVPDDFKYLFTGKQLQWAYTIVNTRSVYFDFTKYKLKQEFLILDAPKIALVPLFDMFNHKNGSGVEYEHCTNTNQISLRTSNFLPRNKQIFITYGCHSNEKLMIEYGFVLLPYNEIDRIEFQLDELISPHLLNKSTFQFIQRHNFHKNLFVDKTGFSFSTRAILIIASNVAKNTKDLERTIFGSMKPIVNMQKINEICDRKLKFIQREQRNNNDDLLKLYYKSQENLIEIINLEIKRSELQQFGSFRF